jgi:hypothetical protein
MLILTYRTKFRRSVPRVKRNYFNSLSQQIQKKLPTYLAWKTPKRNKQKSLNNTEHVLYFSKHSAQANQFVWKKQCNSKKKDAFLWAVIIENILHRTQSIYFCFNCLLLEECWYPFLCCSQLAGKSCQELATHFEVGWAKLKKNLWPGYFKDNKNVWTGFLYFFIFCCLEPI